MTALLVGRSNRPGPLVIRNARVFDPLEGRITPSLSIYTADDVVVSVLPDDLPAPDGFTDARIIDAAGRVASPGFIDAHVHLLGYESDLGAPAHESPFYVAARSADLMIRMLRRGFTTVRDVGGADHGLVRAVEEGYLRGPRIIHGGPALSQTGGHGDFRGAGDTCIHTSAHMLPTIGLICDGVPAIRAAVRQEIRRGARHIKLMLGGGIASPTDRIDSSQFSEEEIAAAVEEATNANIYVTGHAYTSRSIARALRLGVQCIEHGTLVDAETARLFAEKGAFLVPTLGTGALLASPESAEFGMTDDLRAKAESVTAQGLRMLSIARDNGVKIAFGTDFIGPMQQYQSSEWRIRAQVLSPLEILRSATTASAELLREEGRIGRIAPGYRADIVVLAIDPMMDVAPLADPERSIDIVIARGEIVD